MHKSFICINGRKIGKSHPPYIVAELSANHNGDINRAFKIMEEAKKAGADAIKLQTYTPDTITLNSDNEEFLIKDGLWRGLTLHELYQNAFLPWEWHIPLFKKAKELNITVFSSPFDFTAIEFLEKLDTPAYKIASFEIIDLPLIKRVAQTKKPMIISTGMANEEEIVKAIKTARNNGCEELAILHCVSEYPAPIEQYNLATIKDMAKRFNVLSGLSDHTLDSVAAIASVALGACIIEKHVTLDKNGGGMDDSFSLEPKAFTLFCQNIKAAWQALGKVSYQQVEAEKSNVQFRRSLYVVEDIATGEKLNKNNIRSIRPNYGLAPEYYETVLGKTAKYPLKKGSPLSFNDFE